MASIACKLGGTTHTHTSVAAVRQCADDHRVAGIQRKTVRDYDAEHARNLAAWGPGPTHQPTRREEDRQEWEIANFEFAQDRAEMDAFERAGE